jgi:hypothetical protein
VVWNIAEGEQSLKIDHWLHSIEATSKKAHVFIVGTHLDDENCNKKAVPEFLSKMEQSYSGNFF